MGIPVLILGASGSGKSASLRNFSEDDVGIFNVASKPLPFRKKLPKVDHANYGLILKALSKGNKKTYVIDDSQYLLVFEEFERAKEIGYGKFTDIAQNFCNIIRYVQDHTSDDTIVYFLHHTEIAEDGHVKAKTVGKMLDSKLTVEGMFSVVLLCGTDGNAHWFETQSDGYTTAKSPMEMFDSSRIDNDLKMVDTTIREYWGLNDGT